VWTLTNHLRSPVAPLWLRYALAKQGGEAVLKGLARGAFLALLALSITAWVVAMAAPTPEPQHDPDVYWLA